MTNENLEKDVERESLVPKKIRKGLVIAHLASYLTMFGALGFGLKGCNEYRNAPTEYTQMVREGKKITKDSKYFALDKKILYYNIGWMESILLTILLGGPYAGLRMIEEGNKRREKIQNEETKIRRSI